MLLAERPIGQKKARKSNDLHARQVAATEELARITKVKVEAMERSNEIELMAMKTDDLDQDAQEYIRLSRLQALKRIMAAVEEE